MRASGRTPPTQDENVNQSIASQKPVSLKDPVLRGWLQDDQDRCPPRLCLKDLDDFEAYRTRLAAWIKRQC